MSGGWLGRKRVRVAETSAFEARRLTGVPDVFTQDDTTYGMQRRMATEVRDVSAQTPVEKGLAISLLAVVEDFEATVDRLDRLVEKWEQMSRMHREANRPILAEQYDRVAAEVRDAIRGER